MILDNFINSAKMFLAIFNLKLENKKINELSRELNTNSRINIFDLNNNIVGTLFCTGEYYYTNIMLEDKIVVSKSYRNLKEESTFNFKYDVINISGKNLLSGFFTTKKLDDGTIAKNNEYRVLKSKKYCVFNSSDNKFNIKDNSKNIEIIFHDNVFEFNNDLYSLKIYILPNYVYCEKKYNYFHKDPYLVQALDTINAADIYYGYEVNWNKTTISKEVMRMVNDVAPEYLEFITDFKEDSDEIYDGLYYSTINNTIPAQSFRGIFKEKKESGQTVISKK